MKKIYKRPFQELWRINLLIISFIILLSGCAIRITPQPSENVRVEKRYAVLDLSDVRIKVRPQNWGYEPQRLSNYFTPFYIEFQNKQDHPVILSKDSFILIDDDMEQYKPVDAEEVSRIVYGYSFEENWYISPGYISPGYIIVADSTQLYSMDEKMRREFEEKLEGYRNIKQKSFQFGKVYPNAKQKGFIFFPEISNEARSLELKYKNYTIYFSIE